MPSGSNAPLGWFGISLPRPDAEGWWHPNGLSPANHEPTDMLTDNLPHALRKVGEVSEFSRLLGPEIPGTQT